MAVGFLAAEMTLTLQWEATVHHQRSCLMLDTPSCSCTLLPTAPFARVWSPAVCHNSKQFCAHLEVCTDSDNRLFAIQPISWRANLSGCPTALCLPVSAAWACALLLWHPLVCCSDLWHCWAASKLLSSLSLTKWAFNYRNFCSATTTKHRPQCKLIDRLPSSRHRPIFCQRRSKPTALCPHKQP